MGLSVYTLAAVSETCWSKCTEKIGLIDHQKGHFRGFLALPSTKPQGRFPVSLHIQRVEGRNATRAPAGKYATQATHNIHRKDARTGNARASE
jgi:hypothetical protein